MIVWMQTSGGDIYDDSDSLCTCVSSVFLYWRRNLYKIIADAKRFNIHFEKCRMEKRKQKEKGYRNKRGSIHNRFTRREPYTDFICMTEGKNSEAHVKHAREKEDSAYHYPKKDD